jgi:glycosyltransferase involved in cell wall biosynthesis
VRIAIVAPPWVPIPPPAYGGTELAIDLLARGLQAAGHEVLLFTTGESTCPVPRAFALPEADGMNMGSCVTELGHVMEAYDVVRDHDVVHDHTIAGPVYSERFPTLPVVTTNHGPFNPELSRIYRRIDDRVSLIAISHDQASRARGIKIAAVIHHGIDTAQFPVGRGDGEYFLYLGRMAPQKGVHRAARVARAAGVRLIIAAKMREAAERRYFESMVEPLLGPDVTYVGEVTWDDKLELLLGATAVLNPIRWPEPFGLVMIEALATGTPVLAFAEGAAPEIIDDGVTGFLCADEAAMVEAIGRVGALDRSACRAAVEARFSVERMVAAHVALYERAIGMVGGSSYRLARRSPARLSVVGPGSDDLDIDLDRPTFPFPNGNRTPPGTAPLEAIGE